MYTNTLSQEDKDALVVKLGTLFDFINQIRDFNNYALPQRDEPKAQGSHDKRSLF